MKKGGRRRRARANWLFKRERERESGEINSGRDGARGESYANSEQWLLIERKKLAGVECSVRKRAT